MLVHPAPGLIVIRPDTNQPLAPGGADVPDVAWCNRRLRDGDVLPGLAGTTPTSTPVPTPPPVPTPNPTPTAAGIATTTTAGLVKGGGNVTIASDGAMNAPVGSGSITVGTTAGTIAGGNDTRIVGAAQASSLATVATSGKYSDLTGLPAIPAVPGLATSSAAGLVKPGTGLAVAADGTLSTTATGGTAYTLTAATASNIGGVKPGAGLTVAADGTLSTTGAGGTSYTLPTATATTLGGIKVGANLTVAADGTLSGPAPSGASYTLPPATATVLGGLKVGAGLTAAADGTVSVRASPPIINPYTAAGIIAPTDEWANVNVPDGTAMMLPAPTVEGHELTVKRRGTGGFTLTGNFDDTPGAVLTTGSGSAVPMDVINLRATLLPAPTWQVRS